MVNTSVHAQISGNMTQEPQCPVLSVYSLRNAKCMPLPTQGPIAPFDISQEAPVYDKSHDNYVYGSVGTPSKLNYERTFNDLNISADQLRITSSVALAGAISSIRFKGFELITSGGHGAAVQLISHDWNDGEKADECKNPTEAGNTTDDKNIKGKLLAYPYHGPSSSRIIKWKKLNTKTLFTQTSLADYVAPGTTSQNYGFGTCRNTANPKHKGRNVYLNKFIQMNPFGLSNTFIIDASIKYPFAVNNSDIQLVMYLSRYFKREYLYSPTSDLLVLKLKGLARKFNSEKEVNECFSNTTFGDKVGRIFTDDSLGMAMGIIVLPEGDIGAITYSQTSSDYAPPQPHLFRNLAAQKNYKKLAKSVPMSLKTLIMVGSLDEVKANMKSYCVKSGLCGSATDPLMGQVGSDIFDWNAYLEYNQELKAGGINSRDLATSHWLQYGLREGRRGHKQFWTKNYLAKNPELISVSDYILRSSGKIDYCRAVDHYLRSGRQELREY